MTIAAVSSLLGIPVPTIRSWERRYGFPVARRGPRASTAGTPSTRSTSSACCATRSRAATPPARRSTSFGATRREDRPRTELLDRFLEAAMRLDPTELRETLMTRRRVARRRGHDPRRRAARDARDGQPVEGGRLRHRARAPGHRGRARRGSRASRAMAPPPFRPFPLVLACGPKDLHTIGLEAFGVVLARRGWSIRTLGPLTPVDLARRRGARRRGARRGRDEPAQRHPAAGGRGDRRPSTRCPACTPSTRGRRSARRPPARTCPAPTSGDDIVEAADILERTLADAA